ncbi:alpha/beta hydrolase [Clostridium ihumii]|uniref:alpha/beta hydrolase n=1 Tax=Clostridium ihumii TaxID=1470356 RepID=UPI00058C3B42|nr:alpha/beta hydrolase-fold protein [Clostridium ihumii]
MEKYLLKSNTIIDLEEKIRINGLYEVEKFLHRLNSIGTPILERLEKDDENSLLTFIYESDKECESVLFVPNIGEDRYKDKYKDFQMKRLKKTNIWYITYKVKNDIRLMYYFSPNDPLDDDWDDRFDNRVTYDKFNKNILNFKGKNGIEDSKASYIIMPNSPRDIWANKIIGVPTGNIDEYIFKSNILNDERKIRVYTPYGYDNNKKKKYAFMILTDGNEYIDNLYAIETLNNLIYYKKIAPIVSIFIDSTEKRDEELTCDDEFGKYVTTELIPWIRRNYNISNKSQDAIIGGLSYGGLTATYFGLKYPDVFGNILSESGSYWYKPNDFICDNNNCYMSMQFKKINKLPLKFYLNIGILEDKYMIDSNINLKNTLKAKGYDIKFQWFNSGHDYLYWGETMAYGLIYLIGDR